MVALALGVARAADVDAPAATERELTVDGLRVTLGAQVTVLGDGALGLHYFPDEGTSAIGSGGRFELVLAAANDSYVVEGADLFHLTSARRVLSPGPPGSFDNGYAGISAVYAARDGALYAYYHAEDHEGIPGLGPNQPPGYYASVALAVSTDGGRSFAKLGQVVTSGKPKNFQAYPNHNARGAGLPGVAADRSGRYLYLYYTDQSFVSGGAQICVARADLTQGVPGPGRWLKFDGRAFTEPGLGGRDVPLLSVANLNQAHAMYPHVTYSASLDRYLMFFNVNQWQEPMNDRPPRVSGIYLSASDDGLKWGAPVQLVADYSYPLPLRSISWEASLLWDERGGSSGWLVYGYSPRWGRAAIGGIPHYLVARRMMFARTR